MTQPTEEEVIPQRVFVVVRSIGEYSDRVETPIRFTLTEAEAQAAVDQAEREKGLPDPVPYPPFESMYAWQLEDGSWWEGAMPSEHIRQGAKWREMPDAQEKEARRASGVEAWRNALIAAGRVDPNGGADSYAYFEVTLFSARAAIAAMQSGDKV